jgi:hypothetical protein
MPDKKPPLISLSDLFTLGWIPFLAVLSWTVPERYWDAIARGAVGLARWRAEARPRSRQHYNRHALEGHVDARTLHGMDIARFRHRVVARMQTFREFRPGGWTPKIDVHGLKHIEAAQARGKGVVLWVSPFTYSDLVTKKGLYEVGCHVSHVSHPNHGFSTTGFGIRVINPIGTRIEDRHLAERLLLGDANASALALMLARRRLRQNRVVSITVGRHAPKTVRVAFFDTELVLSTGPVRLARLTDAVLLSVCTVRTDKGTFAINIEGPLDRPSEQSGEGRDEAVFRRLVQGLEHNILRYPSQFLADWRSPGFVDI